MLPKNIISNGGKWWCVFVEIKCEMVVWIFVAVARGGLRLLPAFDMKGLSHLYVVAHGFEENRSESAESHP
jgi:hypothetical protein